MKIISVEKNSQAEQAGILPGDNIISINNNPINDHIDFMFHSVDEDLEVLLKREDETYYANLFGMEEAGIELEPMRVSHCGNHCLFCFIDQNPPGMRKEIYVKDEDYRFSFLYGSYVTLANMKNSDIDRIIEQQLSPLYISIHATDTDVRTKLLGISGNDGLNENLAKLLKEGIRFHCQIVVVPGINDGDVLAKTISDLHEMEGILSAAVVPVGLTGHRQKLFPISPVTKEDALKIIKMVNGFQKQFRKKTGNRFVYCADELFIRAGLKIPSNIYYEDFPQLENGVGMLRDFLNSTSKIGKRLQHGILKGKYVLITGVSMTPYIEDFAAKLSEIPGISARVISVENKFYGPTVTVSGLLTGRDIIDSITSVTPDETIILPPNCLNTDGFFLDGLSPEDIGKAAGVPFIQAEYDPLAVFMKDKAEEKEV